jgi:soluble lytic murein transglycosylase-like protein
MEYEDSSFRLAQVDTPFTGLAEGSGNLIGRLFEDPVNRRMAAVLGSAVIMMALLVALTNLAHRWQSGLSAAGPAAGSLESAVAEAAAPSSGVLAAIFSPEVKFWESKIVEWSAAAGVDPNLAAIIMQVESCGDPQAVSSAGAMGLFQVMPFHFEAGEDGLDPDTNARRGLGYFAGRLQQTNGDIGRSFAGYNGGHVAADGNWDSWANETQRYYVWTTGIFQDLKAGLASSPTLQRWLEAGGASLCRQAAERLGL